MTRDACDDRVYSIPTTQRWYTRIDTQINWQNEVIMTHSLVHQIHSVCGSVCNSTTDTPNIQEWAAATHSLIHWLRAEWTNTPSIIYSKLSVFAWLASGCSAISNCEIVPSISPITWRLPVLRASVASESIYRCAPVAEVDRVPTMKRTVLKYFSFSDHKIRSRYYVKHQEGNSKVSRFGKRHNKTFSIEWCSIRSKSTNRTCAFSLVSSVWISFGWRRKVYVTFDNDLAKDRCSEINKCVFMKRMGINWTTVNGHQWISVTVQIVLTKA